MGSIKVGDLVTIRGERRTGVVLSLSAAVPYEGSYARVFFDSEVKSIRTTLITKVE